MFLRIVCVLCIAALFSGCSHHTDSPPIVTDGTTRIQACFTPGQDCTGLIVDTINAAQKSIEVQAYSFTSYPIAKALVSAAGRGVKVQVILDKSQFGGPAFSSSGYLYRHGIPLFEDNTVAIAHNKVMIFDDNTVETGSFNFTKAAQAQNAENVLIINNSALSAAYLKNWQDRKNCSLIVNTKSFQN